MEKLRIRRIHTNIILVHLITWEFIYLSIYLILYLVLVLALSGFHTLSPEVLNKSVYSHRRQRKQKSDANVYCLSLAC